jgi:hypothetical protein
MNAQERARAFVDEVLIPREIDGVVVREDAVIGGVGGGDELQRAWFTEERPSARAMMSRWISLVPSQNGRNAAMAVLEDARVTA